MKKSLVLRFCFLLGIASVLTGCSFWPDEKFPEIVDDPMTEETYYIIGRAYDLDTDEPLAGVTVVIGNQTVLTDENGVYQVTVHEKGLYTVEFSKKDYYGSTQQGYITVDAKSHSTLVISGRLVQPGPLEKIDPNGYVVGNKPTEPESSVTITVPKGAIPEDADTYLRVTQHDHPITASTSVNAGAVPIATPLSSLHIEAYDIKNFAAPLRLTWKNLCAPLAYFDEVKIYSQNDPVTKVSSDWKSESGCTHFDEHYFIERKDLMDKYLLEINSVQETSGVKKGEPNTINGQASVKVDNSGSMKAITNCELKVRLLEGWEFIVSPEEALEALGVARKDQCKTPVTMLKIVELMEGNPQGFYTIDQCRYTSVNGGYVMYYRNDSKYIERTYTFSVIVNGKDKKKAVVKLKRYVGDTETYYNVDAKMHSGGKM